MDHGASNRNWKQKDAFCSRRAGWGEEPGFATQGLTAVKGELFTGLLEIGCKFQARYKVEFTDGGRAKVRAVERRVVEERGSREEKLETTFGSTCV